jgi:uncharacterized protein YndB with AHSA1/START domain
MPNVRIVDENIFGEVEIAAPPERVFAALTVPAELAAWWGSGDTYRTFDYEIDLKPGGRWSCKAQNPKTVTSVGGEYLVVEPPRVLSYTWEPGWDSVRGTVVRFELTPTPWGTRVLLTHTGWGEAVQARQNHTDGWNRVLGWLEGYLGKTA